MQNENLDPSLDNLSNSDRDIEKVLRPASFSDFSGQDKILTNLKIFVQAAVQRGEALDHVLLTRASRVGENDAEQHHRQRDAIAR